MNSPTPRTTPLRLDLKKDEKLEIHWQDGHVSVYSISLLRTMCPCAMCREVRNAPQPKKSSLTILPGNFAEPITALSAELIGNYAMKFEWSDQHGSGIYSFEYLRQLG
jgi:DUF971 family protein